MKFPIGTLVTPIKDFETATNVKMFNGQPYEVSIKSSPSYCRFDYTNDRDKYCFCTWDMLELYSGKPEEFFR